jgi:hypothetical protein
MATYYGIKKRPGLETTSWQHWTSEGLLQVFYVSDYGVGAVAVFFRGQYLGIDLRPNSAAEHIAEGKFDADAGFLLSTLNVPKSVSDWNGFSGTPRYEIPYN